MERPLLMFDTDGILETSDPAFSGPIKIDVLKKLRDTCAIFIVSESPFYPKDENGRAIFTLVNYRPSKYLNLEECINIYKTAYNTYPKIRLYISNSGNIDQARRANVTYIKHDLFQKTLVDLGLMEKGY